MNKRLTIIGGGITGLSAAYIAARMGWKVTVLEESSQLGGLIRTFLIGGNRIECYYHHFFIHDTELLWLLRELNLTDEVEFNKTTMGVFHNGMPYEFNGVIDILRFPPFGVLDKVRFGLTSIYLGKLAEWQSWEGVSALDWFYRYAGKRATESVWRPMLEVKFGQYAKDVPVSWMIGRLAQRMNSRKKGEERLGYLRGSLQRLLDVLVGQLKDMGVEIVLGARADKMLIKDKELYGVETPSGRYLDGLFLATVPTTHLVPLLKEEVPDYADELSKIEYFGAVCTIIELDRRFSNFYWLNIADKGFPFGGIIEHTNMISPDEYNGSHIVYLSKYFVQDDPLASASTAEIKSIMLEPLKRINRDFEYSWIKNVYVFRTLTAATVCGLNFSRKVPKCESPVKNLYLANISHVYPDERSCNNSIRVAAKACATLGIDSSIVLQGNSLSGSIGMQII